MAMIAGTVTVSDDGTETKTANSMAEAIYDSFVDNYPADTGETIPAGAEGAPIKQNFATLARRFAVIVTYLAANADVRILIADSALQRDPSSGNDTLGPTTDKILSGALE